jgi:hypothetical protein
MRTEKKLWRNRRARRELARRLQPENPGLQVVHPHEAGIGFRSQSLTTILERLKLQVTSSTFQLLLCLFPLAKVLTTGDSLFCVRSNRQFLSLLRPCSLLRVFSGETK